jgi:hypothetical protein
MLPLQMAVALATLVVHLVPQPPQLWTSVLVVGQVPLQQVWPELQHAARLVPLQQLCPLEQQATAPPGAMQGAPPASLQAPQAVTQAMKAGSRWPVAA